MKKQLLQLLLIACIGFFGLQQGFGQIMISQYIETNSGSTPKGIEVFNHSGADIVFSATNNLQVFQGQNGGSCSALPGTNITSGTLRANEVWVIGTSDLVTFANTNGANLSGTTSFGFIFNGDDALQLRLGGTIVDLFGTCGSDPGPAWTGGSVSTANSNIQTKDTICTGTTTSWTDPSGRYENVAGGNVITGFGNAPVSCITISGPTLILSETSQDELNYIVNNGPSAAQSFDVSGTDLDGTDVTITAPTNFEVSTTETGTYSTSETLTAFDGTATTLWVRLSAGDPTALSLGSYTGDVTVSGGGDATDALLAVSGNVNPQPPANDDCANAIALVVNDAAISGTLNASTFVTPFDRNDVWYSITPAYDETYTITVDNFSGDVDLFLFNQSSACPTTTTDIDSSETASSSEEISIALVSGTTYYLRVEAFNVAAENTFDIAVTAPAQRDFDTEVFEPATQLSQVPAST